MGFLDNKKVGNRLKNKREETGLSPRKYAMKAGIDPSHYSKIEKGKLPVTENVLEKLLTVYGLEKNFLLYGTNGTIVPDNTPVSHFKPQGGHGSESELISLLRELNELRKGKEQGDANLKKQLLDYAQTHQDLLELVIHELGLVRAKLEKRKLPDILIERNNTAKQLLRTRKKEGT